jgi:peptidylprolyl isomerase
LRQLLVALFALAFAFLPESRAQAFDPENTLYIDLDSGRVVVELYPDVAPRHVERIKTLVREGFYDGIVFHRVIDGFMAQTGDPTGTGMGGSSHPDLAAEFSDRPFERGALGMARSSAPDSANSQFFIMFARAPHLDGQYTLFGRVAEGMEHVDAIKRGDAANNGMVSDPDRMLRVQVAADAD